MLHVEYDRKGSVGKIKPGHDPLGAWRQNELMYGKPPV
jgi:hypothetical protein